MEKFTVFSFSALAYAIRGIPVYLSGQRMGLSQNLETVMLPRHKRAGLAELIESGVLSAIVTEFPCSENSGQKSFLLRKV